MSVVTREGDQGMTCRFGGEKIRKDNINVRANGDIDELNSSIGLLTARSDVKDDILRDLKEIQSSCFVIGAEIATSGNGDIGFLDKVPKVSESEVDFLEDRIFKMERLLPVLGNFLLPGGHPKAAMAFWLRSIARRAERSVVSLSFEAQINPFVLKYLNRLSDYFYVLGRTFNVQEDSKEEIWRSHSSR